VSVGSDLLPLLPVREGISPSVHTRTEITTAKQGLQFHRETAQLVGGNLANLPVGKIEVKGYFFTAKRA
jgi:hypothetical protein